jgi:hypothetical protein
MSRDDLLALGSLEPKSGSDVLTVFVCSALECAAFEVWRSNSELRGSANGSQCNLRVRDTVSLRLIRRVRVEEDPRAACPGFELLSVRDVRISGC